jgi:hypothetical protein
MNELDKNTGILTKDFIKKLLNRENELENTIFELTERIKALETSDDKCNDVPQGYDIFMKMIKYASLSWSLGDGYDNMPTLSIIDCPLMPDEVEYVNRLMEERKLENATIGISKYIKPTYIDTAYCGVDLGINTSPIML